MVSRTLTGADAKLYINNKLVGIVEQFMFTYSNSLKEIYGIDDSNPQELAEGQNKVSGRMTVIMLRNDSLEQRGIMAAPHNVRLAKYITMCMVDRFTDKVIFQADRVQTGEQTWEIATKKVIKGQVTFQAIGFVNAGM